VTVSHPQWKERNAIRQTWGKDQRTDGKRTVAYFLLGYNTRYQSMILNESLHYQDIIQKNFTDTYYNLTLKVLMGIEWAHEFCPSVSFVMKTDSDMFVNTYYLTELLSERTRTHLYTGFVKANEKPIRYALSDLVEKILTVSKHIPILKLEDVYFGLCLQKLNVTPVELQSVQTFHVRKVEFSICNFHKLVTSHGNTWPERHCVDYQWELEVVPKLAVRAVRFDRRLRAEGTSEEERGEVPRPWMILVQTPRTVNWFIIKTAF
ncbi:hypothetical protein scyTo_0017460, partial [Scyliorhinus torazame]|nr:hypothetical protein [Scyliorhinus torazame]